MKHYRLIILPFIILFLSLACDCDPNDPARNPCQMAGGAIKAVSPVAYYWVK